MIRTNSFWLGLTVIINMGEELGFWGDMVSSVLYRVNLQWAFRRKCSEVTRLLFSLSASGAIPHTNSRTTADKLNTCLTKF